MTDARIGYGTSYEINSGSGFVEIAEVINVTPGESTTDRIDATHMKSPGRRREYISGLIDSGEATFEINWIPGSATDVLLRDLQTSGQNVQHRITWANGVNVMFDGPITGFAKATPIDDKMTGTITVAVSGAETWGSSVAPVNTLLPSISGQPKVGQTLTAVPGSWTGAPTFGFQWKKNGTNISGSTGPTYVPVSGDVGASITVSVTGTNGGGNSSAVSYGTANVVA